MADEFDRLLRGILEEPAEHPSEWDEPPPKWVEPSSWDWVDGDPVRAAQFSLFQGVNLAISSIPIFVSILSILELLNNSRTVVPFAFSAVQVITFSTAGVCVILVLVGSYIPKRFPVVRRLGMSSTGLRMVLGLRELGTKVWWGDVTRVGLDWLVVRRGLFSQSFVLTPYQGQRLVRFLQSERDRLAANQR